MKRWSLGIVVLAMLSIAGIFTAASSASASDLPIAAYSFDEGEGTTVEDLTGNGHAGEIEGAQWSEKGKYGGALDFGGEEGECVTVPDAEDLRITEELTLEAWVKPRYPVQDDPIVFKDTWGYLGYALGISLAHYGKPEGFIGEGAESESVVGATQLEPNVWAHLAFTYDGVHMRLYVNGELVNTEAQPDGPLWGEGPLAIGCNPDYSPEHFNGLIDEVRVYDRALGAGEIGADKGAGLASASRLPVAAYSFDAGEGEVAEDLFGEHDGEIEGAQWFDNGRYGKALSFDGEEDCVTVADAEDLRITEEFTLEAWVRPESPLEDDPIVFKNASGNLGYAMGISLLNYGKPEGFIDEGEGANQNVVATEELDPKVWTHLAFTYDGAHMRLYVNGELVASKAQAIGPEWGEGPLTIGCNTSYPEHFKGLIDEVRIYNRALSQGEISADKDAGLQTPSRGPIAAYSFDEGEGESVEDLTGNGHAAAIEGASWTTHGRYGGAMQFSSEAESMLSIPDSDDLDLTEEFTLEAWVRPESEEEWETLFAKEDSASPYYSYLIYARDHDARLAAHLDDGEEEFEVTSEPATLRQRAWAHVAITFDGAKARIYIDGELVKACDAPPLPATDGDLRIGGNDVWGEYFDGRIDEVRIYDRALDGGEIDSDMAAPLQTPQRLPVAAYSFDEGEGTSLEDLTGNGHTGTIEGASWAPGRYGSALEFDAAEEDVVKVPDSPDLDFSEEFTLEAWVRPSQLNNEVSPAIFKSAGEGEGSQSFAYRLYEGGAESNHPMAAIKPDPETTTYVQSSEALPEHVWSHIAMTYDGSWIRIYVDGEEVNAIVSDSPAITNGDLEIGAASALGHFFDGRIDEVRIYNRALNEGEVSADKDAGLQTPSRGPIAAYSFDEGEGTSLEDLTGNGHTGTIEGAQWSEKGKYGGALDFGGEEGECVTVPDAEDLRITEELTLEAWVKPRYPLQDDPIVFKDSWGYLGYALGISLAHYGKPEGFIGEGAQSESVVGPTQLDPNVWAHLAYTYDGAHMRLYVNGELVATQAQPDGPIWGEGPLAIGCNPDYSPEHFNGLIDEVRVYDRALGAGEIGADKGAGLATPSRLPVAAYSFDAGEGEVAEDLFGEHDGEIEGAEWFEKGKYGKALSFDGEEDCVTVADAEDLRITEEFTLEAWVRPESPLEDDPIVFKNASGNLGYAMGISLLNYGKPEGFIDEGEGANRNVVATEELDPKVWSHLAFTYDGAHMRLYVNGELAATKAQAIGPEWGEGPLTIGCNTSYPEHFKGLIDEVRIYNRALDPGEIGADENAGLQTPSRAPVAAYSFDEGEGTTVEDLTGNGHTAAIEGASWTTHGRYGGAMQFSSEAESTLSIPDADDLDLTEEFTLEAWVRPESEEEWETLFAKEDTASPYYSYLIYARDHDARLAAHLDDGEEEVEITSEPAALRQRAWAHVAVTFDGAKARIYIDGQLVKACDAPPLPATDGDLRLGGNSAWGEYFEGRMDEVRIYDRALDGAEVDADMAAPLQTPQQLPVAAYSFDEGEGTTVEDLTGNGHTGTIEGADWAPGRFGSALEFDAAEEDVVKVPDSPDLDFSEEFTLEAWVRPSQLNNEVSPAIFKSAGEGEGSQSFAYRLYEGGAESNHPMAAIKPDSETTTYVESTEALPEHVWSHIAMTYDGSWIRIYVDGEEVNAIVSESPAITNGDLEIGAASALGHFFDGRIDELRIYNRALNGGEISADKDASLQTPSRGPIAAYSFDEGEGTTVEDLTGNGHTGEIEGAQWSEKGKYGGALDFGGEEGECVTVPDAEDLRITEELTLEAWVRPRYPVQDDPIVFKDTWGYLGYALGISLAHYGKPEGFIGEGAESESAVGPTQLEPNVWAHLAFTYDGAHMRLYVNGELVATEAQPDGPLWGEGPLAIGCNPDYSPEHFNGLIDEVRVYDRALGAGEVLASMGLLPSAQTTEAYGTTESETVLTAQINPQGLETTYRFQYGLTKAYGDTAPEAPEVTEEPVSATEPIEVEEWVGELEPETTYHYRVIATNDSGTVVGQDQTVTTEPGDPEAAALFLAKTKAEKEKEEEEREKASRGNFAGMVGINWNGDLSNAEALANRVAASGAKMFRVPIGVVSEGNKNLFLLMAERGITILPNVVGIAGLKTGNKYPSLKGEPARGNWKAELEDLLNEYGPEGELWEKHSALAKFAPEYWEIWNEPNAGPSGASGARAISQASWAERYGELLEVAREAFTTADSQAKILFGGVLSVGQWNPHAKPKQEPHMTVGAFIRQVGHYADYDALAVHPYAFTGKKAQSPTGSEVSAVVDKVMKNIRIARRAMEDVKANWVNAIKEGGGTPPAESRKPIWVTEFGWPVAGHLAFEDEHHRLVAPNVQKDLLNASFNRMKGNHGTGNHELNIENLLYYNIQDNNQIPPAKELESLPKAQREAIIGVARQWDNHCGLMENEKGVGREEGKMRAAWSAFVAQAK